MMYTLTLYLLERSLALLNNIFSPTTLPLPACIPYYPTLLPYGGMPIHFSPKLSEFERIKRMRYGSGCWVSNCSVVLPRNKEVSYYDIQSVCNR